MLLRIHLRIHNYFLSVFDCAYIAHKLGIYCAYIAHYFIKLVFYLVSCSTWGKYIWGGWRHHIQHSV